MIIVFQVLVCFLSLVGIFTIAIVIYNSVTLSRENNLEDITIVVFAKDKEEKIEYILRSLLNSTEHIVAKDGNPGIIVVNLNMDNETYEICSLLERDNERLTVMGIDRFIDKMENIKNII